MTPHTSMIDVQPSRWPAALVLAGLAATAAGFFAHAMWRVLPWERFALSLVLGGLSLLLAWPLRRFLRWSWTTCIAICWLAALVWFVGPAAIVAAIMLGAAGLVVGLRFAPGQPVIATTTGLVLIAGMAGWLLTWPVHTTLAWYAVLGALLVWQREALRDALSQAGRDWSDAVQSAPRWSAAAVLLLGLASTACWLPTMQDDDLAYHLGIPYQLMLNARYGADPTHQVWANAPWTSDVLHGITALLARSEARGGLTGLWLALSAGLAWTVSGRLGGTATERWASVALFASFPPLVWMAAGMQTELAATAVMLALTAVVISPQPPRMLLGTVLLAGLAALKGFHLVAALPLVAYAGWRHRDGWSWRQLVIAVPLAIVIAGSSYWMSWWRSGNPFLPLFNGFFQSPFYPLHSYSDTRWLTGFTATLPWQMVFDTDRYVEAWDGGIGFTLVALSGLWLVALLRKATRPLAVVASLAALIPLIPLQYARYAYPGILLLGVVLLPGARGLLGPRHFAFCIAAVCFLNLAFQANASWLHHSAALKRVIRSGGDPTQVYPYYVPERTLLSRIPDRDDGRVLATDPQRSYIAELGGRGRMVRDHDPALAQAWRQAQADGSGAEWRRVFTLSQARWILVVPASMDDGLKNALDQAHAARAATVGDAELWKLPEPPAATP